MKDTDTKLLEEAYDDIQEGMASDVGHIILDLAGLVPGYGEYFDAANALWYAGEKNWLYAGLSLLSVIPIIGDAVGKGGKLLHKLEKGRKAGATMYKAGKVMKSGKTVAKLNKAKSAIKVNAKLVDKVFDKAKENEKLAPYVPNMQQAINDFANQQVAQQPSEVPNLVQTPA